MEVAGVVDGSDEARADFLRSAAALDGLPPGLRAQLSSMAKPTKLKEDRCQVCGLRLDGLEVRLGTAPGKSRKVKMIARCVGCRSVSSLPLPKRKHVEKEVPQPKLNEKTKKKVKPVQLPVLSKTEKRSSKASRLAKLAASMAKEEEKTAKDSSLTSFLKSLAN